VVATSRGFYLTGAPFYSHELRGMVQGQRKNSAGTRPPPASPSSRVVLHVDLDAFFVQVERKLNPTLMGMCDVVDLLWRC